MKKSFAILICLLVGALHFAELGPGVLSSYLIDILLPMAMVLLGSATLDRAVSRYVVAAAVFLVGCAVETLQYLGYPVLGETFDLMDFAMYGLGAGLGVLIDWLMSKGLLTWRHRQA